MGFRVSPWAFRDKQLSLCSRQDGMVNSEAPITSASLLIDEFCSKIEPLGEKQARTANANDSTREGSKTFADSSTSNQNSEELRLLREKNTQLEETCRQWKEKCANLEKQV